ncbi:ectoine hydroxylase [Salininema proteolyticum]|uniref:Ectoine hydroxylase n=1 Tax=Salininema proteolyticum TaxID=1607685 RepID=A0ABV8TX61_9ACTN
MSTTYNDYYPTRGRTERLIPRTDDPAVRGGVDDGPLDAEQLTAHEEKGYTQIPAVASRTQVAEIKRELERLDGELRDDERVIREPASDEVRSVFDVHRLSDYIADFIRRDEVAGVARQILGSDVYIHQSRINFKPGFGGNSFYWHSDFETWHAEDGMPRIRAVSLSVALTDNHDHNGPLMIMPGSHRTFVSCAGETPEDNYKSSLKAQEAGTPGHESLRTLADEHGIDQLTGPAGTGLWFDSNCMHASAGNITPYPRSNLFLVFNSVDNALVEPFAAVDARPDFLGSRHWEPVK